LRALTGTILEEDRRGESRHLMRVLSWVVTGAAWCVLAPGLLQSYKQ